MLVAHQGSTLGACVAGLITFAILSLAMIALIWVARRRVMDGECCAIGCKEVVKRPRLFCQAHWSKLPDVNRDLLAESWDVDPRGNVRKNPYDFFMETVRAVNVLGLMEERISYEEAMHREEQSERAYRNSRRSGGG